MADFAARDADFRAAGITVIAASVDPIDDARKIVAENVVTFPVAYGLDPHAVAAATGGFYEPDPDGDYLHPADFIVMPNGRIISSTYSTAAVGRLSADDALAFIAFKKQHPPAFA